jgi:hypothetical protein
VLVENMRPSWKLVGYRLLSSLPSASASIATLSHPETDLLPKTGIDD